MKKSKQIIFYCACIVVGSTALMATLKFNSELHWPLIIIMMTEGIAIVLTVYGLIRKLLSEKSLPMLLGCMVAILGWYSTGAGFAIGFLFVPFLEWLIRKMKWTTIACIASVITLASMEIIYTAFWSNQSHELPILLADTTAAALSLFLLGNILMDCIKERYYRRWDCLLTTGLAFLIAVTWQYRLIWSLLMGLYGSYFTKILGYMAVIDFCCLFTSLWYLSDGLRRLLEERRLAKILPAIALGILLAAETGFLSTMIYDGEGRIQGRYHKAWIAQTEQID